MKKKLVCDLIDSCYRKKKMLYICVYILICKTNVFIWKLGETLPFSLLD